MKYPTWIKSLANDWLVFEQFGNLHEVNSVGVYIIWHPGQPSRVVYVGQGNIRDRLTAHRSDPRILAYRAYGPLRVTWAALPAADLDGVECYLADQLVPLVGERHPVCVPIPVKLPWAA
jgi:hypothetical protein